MELTLEEAATRLGKSQRQVRYMIRNKRLSARKAGGRWLVDISGLPRSEPQSRAAERKQAALRAAVDEALTLPETAPPVRYSMRNLKAFQLAHPLYQRVASSMGSEHPAVASLREVTLQLARGCHRYEPADKAAAYRAAREHASLAACELLLSGGEGAEQGLFALEAADNVGRQLGGWRRALARGGV